MSSIREAIKGELDSARAAAEKALERVQALEELDAQAAQLGDEEVPAPPSQGVPPVAPAPVRRPRPGARPASAGRRPAAPKPQRADVEKGQAHTASGASPGGRRQQHDYDAGAILEKARNVFARAGEPISISEATRQLDMGPKNDRALNAVRGAVAKLLEEKFIELAGTGRGGHPKYARVARAQERAMPLPPGRPSEGSQLVDGLVDKIVEALEIDGGRVPRGVLKERVGNPEFEDFNVALDRAVNLKKINRVSAGGMPGFELAK